jgi:hypothetical protein
VPIEEFRAVLVAALIGLDPSAEYKVTFAETYDVREKRLKTGREL